MNPLRRLFNSHPPGPEISWLTDDLALCAAPDERDWPTVFDAGIRSVVDLRAEGPNNEALLDSHGLRYLRLPVDEWRAPTESELRLVTQWIAERMKEGPVLVHCREGRGRSAMVACATLVSLGLPLRDAYQQLIRTRPQAALSDEQTALLLSFGEDLARRAAS